MLIGTESDHKCSGIRCVGFLLTLCTKCQVVLNRFTKSLVKFLDGSPLKGNDIPSIQHLAMKYVACVIKLDRVR